MRQLQIDLDELNQEIKISLDEVAQKIRRGQYRTGRGDRTGSQKPI